MCPVLTVLATFSPRFIFGGGGGGWGFVSLDRETERSWVCIGTFGVFSYSTQVTQVTERTEKRRTLEDEFHSSFTLFCTASLLLQQRIQGMLGVSLELISAKATI